MPFPPFQKTAIYSDGSVDGTGTEIASGGGNIISVSVSGKNFIIETGNVSNGVTSWEVSSTGSVTQVGSYSDSSGCGPKSLAATKNGTELFVGCTYGVIDTFTINEDSSLTTLQAPAYNVGANLDVNAMVVDQSGTYLIVNAAESTTQSQFLQLSIGSGGALTLSSSQTGIVGWFPVMIADPSTKNGNYFYAGGSGEETSPNYYIVSESGGTITATEKTDTETFSWPVWIDSTGSLLTMLNSSTNTPQTTYIQQYSIGTSGSLTTSGSTVNINSTSSATASPAQYDSTYGYVIMRAENAIIVGAPNLLNGSMTITGMGTGGYSGLAYVPVG